MTAEQPRGIRYLLGKLPEAEANALAEEMFTSDATFGELEEAESTLVEAYLDDELGADDRQRCESLFRSSSHLNERVELGRGLRARARRPTVRRILPWLPWAAAVVFGLVGGGAALQANRQAAALTARLTEQDEHLRVLEQRLADSEGPAIETWRLANNNPRFAGGAAPFPVSSG